MLANVFECQLGKGVCGGKTLPMAASDVIIPRAMHEHPALKSAEENPLTRFEFTFLTPCASSPGRLGAEANTYLLAKERQEVSKTDPNVMMRSKQSTDRVVTFETLFESKSSTASGLCSHTSGARHQRRRGRSKEEIATRLLAKGNKTVRESIHVRFSLPHDE